MTYVLLVEKYYMLPRSISFHFIYFQSEVKYKMQVKSKTWNWYYKSRISILGISDQMI